MTTLEMLMSYLKDFKYPEIELMSYDDAAKVFNNQNRFYFLTWFITQLDPDIIIPSDEKSQAPLFTKVLFNNGFCTRQTSTKFVQDPLQMPAQEQIKIFNRMLTNLKIWKASQEEEDTRNINYVEQIEECNKFDVNIFPTLGPLKTRTAEERYQKLIEYENEAEQLKHEINLLSKECNSDEVNVDTSEVCMNIDIHDELSDVLSKSLCLLKKRNEEDSICFDGDFENVTENCARNVNTLLQLSENKKIINEFAIPVSKKDNKGESSAICEVIKKTALLSEEILNMSDEMK